MSTPLQNIGGDQVVSFVDFPVSNASAAGQRFFEGFEWRFVFTDLDSITTTWANGLLTGRQIAFVMNGPEVITSGVHPDDFRVNGIFTDGYPRLAQSNRLVFCLRREVGVTTWVCRAAGVLMSPEDEGDEDTVMTHFTAYGSWKLLEARPAMNADGSRPDADTPILFPNTPGNEIALTLLKNTIVNEGTVRIDAGDGSRIGEGPQYADWGGTSFFAGTIEVTDSLYFEADQGTFVADVWDQLCNAGNMDIVLTPIYDPVNRPGYTHELSIYQMAGTQKPSQMFAWDKMNRSASRVSRVHDGTPGAFFNKVEYHAGQGGPPVPLDAPSVASGTINSASVTAYGPYWATQFFPAQTLTDPLGAQVLALAQQALVLAKQGRRTFEIVPVTERAPIALLEYGLGDRVQVQATDRLRVVANGYQRVEAIGIDIDDDGVERVSSVLCSPDFRTP